MRVSYAGGTQPRWAPDGRTLYFRDGRSMIALDLQTEPRIRVLGRRVVFEDRYDLSSNYDVHPAGDGFVMIAQRARPLELVTISDWTAFLADAAPRTAPSGPARER